MKQIIISAAFLLIATVAFCQSSLYNLSVENASGLSLPLSEFRGKKILIAVTARENLATKRSFQYLDSLQKQNPELVLLLIPVNDFGTDTTDSLEPAVVAEKPVNMVLSAPRYGKKDKGEKQDPLLRWLTNVSHNTHFNLDLTTDNQVYIISESGELYAVLEKNIRPGIIDEILRQNDKKRPSDY